MELLVAFTEFALALVFFAAGGFKLFWSREALTPILPHAEDFSDSGFRAVGTVELIASLGLVLPVFFGGLGLLAPVSAGILVGLHSWMAVLHWRRTENGAFAAFSALLVLGLLLIVWARLGPYPL